MQPLALAQVTPYAWEDDHEVNDYVQRVSADLAARGHRVVVVAPSRDEQRVRAGREAIRLGAILPEPGELRVLAVGEALPVPGALRGRAAVPLDVARTVEALFATDVLDVCHVHEPWAPSVASVALRHSRALNVGTFHAPAERLAGLQVARKIAELVFGRLDVRHAAFGATRDLLLRHFAGDVTVVAPGNAPAVARATTREPGPVRLAFVDAEERSALRLVLRALRRLDVALPWEADVVSARGPSSATPLRAELRSRVRFHDAGEAEVLARADVVIVASGGLAPAPALLARGVAAGAVPVASRIPVYEELSEDHGLLFEPGDVDVLCAQLRRLVTDEALLRRLRAAAPPARTWGTVADEVERAYAALIARRHDTAGDPVLRARLAGRARIDVDLHMHTDHSHDCATPVEHLLATARDQGLGAIAVTDHNEVSGALEAAAQAERFGVKVIVGEEVKTATQGEVIGLFLQERIPRGLSLRETVDAIKDQGGLVYVPHPFDRMHSVPDYEHLLTIVEDVDLIEVYNPRVAIASFNEEAERFAAKYRILRAAGSDSHVAAGLGTVRVRMRDFDGPQEFLEALRDAELVTRSGTLLYVQALKFLETRATPRAARRLRRERRVKRATRGS